jgi:hypothetical protein
LVVDRNSNALKTCPFAQPQYVKVVRHLYVFDNEMGAILDGYIASTTTLRYCFLWGTVIGHGIGGKHIPIMARLAKGQTLE